MSEGGASLSIELASGRGRLVVCPTVVELNVRAAEEVLVSAADAIERRGTFAIALSGGATPRGLYKLLATAEYASRLDWARAQVYWGDERAVPPEHPQSNYRMAMEALLSHVPVPRDHIHRMHADSTNLEAAAAKYDALLKRTLPRDGDGHPRLDLVLLGMGADGHTASLFPSSPALREARRWVVANYAPALDEDRMTLTYPAINAARRVVFLVSGPSKASTLAQVLMGPHKPLDLPAQGVQPESGYLLWIADEGAASLLPIHAQAGSAVDEA